MKFPFPSERLAAGRVGAQDLLQTRKIGKPYGKGKWSVHSIHLLASIR